VHKYVRILTIISILLFLFSGCVKKTTPPLLTVHFIDVGQGDAILIDYGHYELLIDGGEYGDCNKYIASYIDGDLEGIVATHPDADHIGGLYDVLVSFNVKEIWLNGDTATSATYNSFMEKVNGEGAKINLAKRGDKIMIGPLILDVLNPVLPLISEKNDNSIILKFSFGQTDFLFTGDISSNVEITLLSSGLLTDTDILKVSHHGSKYGSSTEFLATIKSEISIYSASKNNSYGHPDPEVITRLIEAGSTIYGTDNYGTIVVSSDGNSYSVKYK
jgi:competence protein ComEC